MQVTTQSQQSKYLTAEGKTGIITEFNRKACWNSISQMNFSDLPGRVIDEIAKEYRFNLELMNCQPDGSKEKYKDILKKIKKHAKSQIIKDMVITENHMELFGFRNSDFSKQIKFRGLMIDYIIYGAEKDEFYKDAIREYAKSGHAVDYCFVTDLKRKYIHLIDLDRNPQKDEPESIKEYRHQEIREIFDLINEELNLRNKEKAERPNLCYFILYDESKTLKPGLLEDNESFKEKVYKLSTSNLKELIRIYCKSNNDFYRKDIFTERNTRKMEANRKRYTAKKIFTLEETKGFVKLYKEDGLNNSQIAEIIGCSLRTVERYSKQ
jgi:hypothetical protein